MGQIIIGQVANFGDPGGAFGARTAVTVGITTYVVLPAGWWYVECDAHCSVVYEADARTQGGFGAGTPTNHTLVAASANGLVYSDGYCVGFLGDGTGGTGHQSLIKAAE